MCGFEEANTSFAHEGSNYTIMRYSHMRYSLNALQGLYRGLYGGVL